MLEKLIKNINFAFAEQFFFESKDIGMTYSSYHEAHSLMLEQLEKAEVEVGNVRNDLHYFWQQTKEKDVDMKSLLDVKDAALRLASEAILMAVKAEKAMRINT